MRTWQVERRKRTRHLIELGGLVVKAGIVDLTGDDRATIFGALLWMADKLQSDQGEQARALWAAKGKQAFAVEPATTASRALGLIARGWDRARPSSSMISLRLLTRCPGPSDQRSFFFYGGNFEFSNQTRKPRILATPRGL